MCRVRMIFTVRVQQLTSNSGSGNLLMFLSTPELARSAGECRHGGGYRYRVRVYVNKSFRLTYLRTYLLRSVLLQALQRDRPYRERCS
jgi:hypothetical protein